MGEIFQLLECSLESVCVRKQALLASHAVEVASGDILLIFPSVWAEVLFYFLSLSGVLLHSLFLSTYIREQKKVHLASI